MTEREKMLAGIVYSAVERQLLDELNATAQIQSKGTPVTSGRNPSLSVIMSGLEEASQSYRESQSATM